MNHYSQSDMSQPPAQFSSYSSLAGALGPDYHRPPAIQNFEAITAPRYKSPGPSYHHGVVSAVSPIRDIGAHKETLPLDRVPRPHLLRRDAIDLTTEIKSDYWHVGKESRVVSRNHELCPSIRFVSQHGITFGVALTEAEYGEGLLLSNDSIAKWMPPYLHHVQSGVLHIHWPGYEHLNYQKTIYFVNPNLTHSTMRQLIRSVAGHYRRFYDKHHDDYNERGIRLGPLGVTFNELRLHQIYTNDRGRNWSVEVSYILAF